MSEHIPEDLRVDWQTLQPPYVEPATLQWAIERDKNMQKFALKLIERIGVCARAVALLKAENERLRAIPAKWKSHEDPLKDLREMRSEESEK